MTGHAGVAWSVFVSADGKRLLTSSGDKTLRLSLQRLTRQRAFGP